MTIIPAREKSAVPRVSVCIPNYNGSEYIEKCIQSVLDQTCDAAIEIIVHDDASTDDSVSLIQDLFPSVTLIISKHNCGFCVSNNRMAAHARGDYLLLLNNDAYLRPGTLEAFLNHAERQFQPGILGQPQYAIHDGSLVDRGYFFDIFLNPIPRFTQGTGNVGAVTGACLWIPKMLWNCIGGFPEWFESVAEDIYLCLAARALGYSVKCLDGPGFDHWVGRNLGGGKIVKQRLSTTMRRRALSERNKTFTMMMLYPSWLLAIVLPLHLFLLEIEGAVITIFTKKTAIFKRIYLPLLRSIRRESKHICIFRHRIQKNKHVKNRIFLSDFYFIPWKLVMLFRFGFPQVN